MSKQPKRRPMRVRTVDPVMYCSPHRSRHLPPPADDGDDSTDTGSHTDNSSYDFVPVPIPRPSRKFGIYCTPKLGQRRHGGLVR